MSTYMARGRTVATAAAAANAVAALWNPSTAYRITVYEIWLCENVAPAASGSVVVQRISVRGVAGSTVTPGIANDDSRVLAPISGALLDLAAYTTQPTVDGTGLTAWTMGASAGAGIIMPFPRGITIPVGAGLALITGNAVAVAASDISFIWTED